MTDTGSTQAEPIDTCNTFDNFGVPRTVAAAQTMTKDAIQIAIINVIAYLEETDESEILGWPTGSDGSVVVDSQLGVDIYNEFVGHLSKSRIKLDTVDQDKWSSVAGLTELLADSFSRMKVGR